MVAGFSEGLQTSFEGQIIMRFFFWRAGGSLYGLLGAGAQAQKTVLGIKDQAFSEEARVQLLDYIMGNAVTSPDYVKGQCCDSLRFHRGGAVRTLAFWHTVKNCGRSCGI